MADASVTSDGRRIQIRVASRRELQVFQTTSELEFIVEEHVAWQPASKPEQHPSAGPARGDRVERYVEWIRAQPGMRHSLRSLMQAVDGNIIPSRVDGSNNPDYHERRLAAEQARERLAEESGARWERRKVGRRMEYSVMN